MFLLIKKLLHFFSYDTRRAITPYIYMAPTIVLLASLMLLPMIVVFRYSLFDNVIMNKNPTFVGLNNYEKLFSNSTFWISLENTLYFTFMSVIFHLLIGMAFALMLNSKAINSTIKTILRVFFIMPWVFTAVIIAIIWRLLLDPSGVINYLLMDFGIADSNIEWFSSSATAIHAVTFVNIWAGYPLYMVSLLAGLQGVSTELYEAASIDGSNEIQKFWYVTIPHLKPIIISIAMLDFIWTMQVFPLVWMTTGGGPIHATEMMSTFTYKLAFTSYKFSLASANAVIILFLSMSVTYFYIKYQKSRD